MKFTKSKVNQAKKSISPGARICTMEVKMNFRITWLFNLHTCIVKVNLMSSTFRQDWNLEEMVIYLNDNNAIEELLKIYEEEINFEKNRTPEYLDILKEKQNECLKILNKLKRDEKQNEKNKYIYDYKYPIKTKHSIVTVKNKKK